MSADYTQMTQSDFDGCLATVIGKMTRAELTSLPGVMDILIEELNNDVLEEWERENPDKAFPSVDVENG